MNITQEEINKISNLVSDLTMDSINLKVVDKGGQVQELLMKIERRISDLKFSTHIYNCGYIAGHNDTVEGTFTDIYTQDMNTYHDDIVNELLIDLDNDN